MCIISTAQHAKPKVIGHIDPCRAQLTTLSIVERTYSALFLGVSRDNWLLPLMAKAVIGVVVEGDESAVLTLAEGVFKRATSTDRGDDRPAFLLH